VDSGDDFVTHSFAPPVPLPPFVSFTLGDDTPFRLRLYIVGETGHVHTLTFTQRRSQAPVWGGIVMPNDDAGLEWMVWHPHPKFRQSIGVGWTQDEKPVALFTNNLTHPITFSTSSLEYLGAQSDSSLEDAWSMDDIKIDLNVNKVQSAENI
jgi:hypothetical protein